MSQGQMDLARMLGVKMSDTNCTSCGKNISLAGSPAPPPCHKCGRKDYCIRCSEANNDNSERVLHYYCVNHLPLDNSS